MRQGLGIRLRVPAGRLRLFVAFLDAQGQEVITREVAVQWAMAPRHAQPATWAWRLGIVPRFAMWRQATGGQARREGRHRQLDSAAARGSGAEVRIRARTDGREEF